MLKVIISGCNGHMGRVVESLCIADPAIEVVAGFDVSTTYQHDFPVYASPSDFKGEADVVIDFSIPASTPGLLAFGKATKTPLVIATTGHTEEQLAEIKAASEEVAIFRSGNMSLGINVLLELVKKAAAVLCENYDIEIVERHHRRKIDAPSGTALMIADAAAEACTFDTEYVYERHSVHTPREKKEIGISAVRGGTIVGEHEIIFAGLDEIVEIKHSAHSRNIFAQGALSAGKFMVGKAPGMYNMSDLVK